MRNRMGVLAGVLCAAAALAAAPDFVAEGNRWWSHVEVLAADNMEGRNTGSDAYRRAARYVAGEFERAGLKAAGTNGYMQPVQFNVRRIEESKSSLALVRNGKKQPLVLGEDGLISLRGDPAASLQAPLAFIGYGLVVPEAKFDDLAGIDVKGKVVVTIAGGPPGIASALRAHYSSGAERWKALRAAGAVGIVSIPNPKHMDVPWERVRLSRLQPSMSIADPRFDESQGLQLAVYLNPASADKLFAGTGHTLAELLARVDAGKPLPHFAISASIESKVAMQRSVAEAPNVAGMMEGSDPKLKSEYVVMSAHLDHVGVGEPIDGDKIYNGSMDDASGIASLIEIAKQLRGEKLKRSVLFVAVTGEEKGELGSAYFSHHPTVPLKSIVADINMDMYLPLFPLKYLEVQGLAESTLGDQIRAACQRAGVEVQADKEPDRNLFIRSDQYSFIKQGVPALAFKFGYVPGSAEEKTAKAWLKQRYHAPSDDLMQPVDKAAAARFNRILAGLAERVANDPARPRWKESSFFRRFAKS